MLWGRGFGGKTQPWAHMYTCTQAGTHKCAHAHLGSHTHGYIIVPSNSARRKGKEGRRSYRFGPRLVPSTHTHHFTKLEPSCNTTVITPIYRRDAAG